MVESDDLFVNFTAIVDDLLGTFLSKEVVSAFLASEDFSVYEAVASDPSNASEDLRAAFFSIVDAQLEHMAEQDINAFVASGDFQIYSAVGAIYNGE